MVNYVGDAGPNVQDGTAFKDTLQQITRHQRAWNETATAARPAT